MWCQDITYITTGEGWLYLASVLDLGSRWLLGYSMAEHCAPSWFSTRSPWRWPLEAARPPRRSPTPTGAVSTRRTTTSSSVRSVSSAPRWVGLPRVSAVMIESLNGTFKAELIKLHGPWRTRDATEIAIIEWIDWYNAVRLHREIGDIRPVDHWYLHNPAARAAVTT